MSQVLEATATELELLRTNLSDFVADAPAERLVPIAIAAGFIAMPEPSGRLLVDDEAQLATRINESLQDTEPPVNRDAMIDRLRKRFG